MLESNPCLLDDRWCIYVMQSWDMAGTEWQFMTPEGEVLAWMYIGRDGQRREGGEATNIQHFTWTDPQVPKEFCRLTYGDIERIWVEVRMDADGTYGARSRIVDPAK
jgi:hypothetical protein